MARPPGRRTACPSPPLATDESAGLPAPVRRLRRSRQIDPKDPSLWERGWRRRSFRPPRASNASALLVREWNGRLERVMILEEGFAWNGQTFRRLSQIAKAMTGTTWNSHLFYG